MGSVFIAARQRVKLFSDKQTWLEALHCANRDLMPIKPDSFYNKMLLSRDEKGGFASIPLEVGSAEQLYTGTVGVIGAKGKALGKYVETQCLFGTELKQVIVTLGREHAGLIDTMLACDHGFARNGMPSIQFFNKRTGKIIRMDGQMCDAEIVVMRLDGHVRTFPVNNREGGTFGKYGTEVLYLWTSNSATIGLWERKGNEEIFGTNFRRATDLTDRPSERLAVLREASPCEPL